MSTVDTADTSRAVRHFGRYQLLRLLGKSARTMAWLVAHPSSGQELVLVLPRRQPADDAGLQRWLQRARQASRVRHPGLAPVLDVGEHERWPYVLHERRDQATLAEKISPQGLPATDLVRWFGQALGGLAMAHDAGMVHGDLQAYSLALDDAGHCMVLGLAVAWADGSDALRDADHGAQALQHQRRDAERDVLAAGLLLHLALSGQAPLGQADTGQVIDQMPPRGREIVRLPFATPRPVAEALRAIVNRATDRQERQRYRSARTLARALDGWRTADAGGSGAGPLALLLDRLRQAGVLPSLPGNASRAGRLALMERERTAELAAVVLEDPALSLELLRMVNMAQVRGAQVSGSGAVLTARRAIAMVGLDGVRRCTLALREWPGPLNATAAAELRRVVDRVMQTARAAQLLRPAGFDAEVAHVAVLLQNLGRLVVQYHFPDEAQQIRKLMQNAPAARPGEPDEPGMGEEAAAFAVLGAGVEELGLAVARHWGFDDEVLHLSRRVPLETAPQAGDSDHDLLRATASCASELVDLLHGPSAQVGAGLPKLAQRYGRLLQVGVKELMLAARGQAISAREGEPEAVAPRRGEEGDEPDLGTGHNG